MGRKQTINEAFVLDCAERLVRTEGVAALTISRVAAAAGVTKGGIQSRFGTKDELIDAMLTRWTDSFESEAAKILADKSRPYTPVAAHVEALHRVGSVETEPGGRASGLMVGLIGAPHRLCATQEWFAARLGAIDVSTPQGRDERLAFLAAEGAFLLRHFNFAAIPQTQWDDIFNDISATLQEVPKQT